MVLFSDFPLKFFLDGGGFPLAFAASVSVKFKGAAAATPSAGPQSPASQRPADIICHGAFYILGT